MRLALLFAIAAAGFGEDWPEWRGRGRAGVWRESGIVERFPADGLKARWRVPLRTGFGGPAVAGGRVFVLDFQRGQGLSGVERVVALDEKTGRQLWAHEWPVNTQGLQATYATGPRATPTVDGDRVYVLGAMGALSALDVRTGKVLWSRDYVKDFGTKVPVWGMTGAPLVDGSRLVCLAGGENGAKVVALDKMTGKEVWRALDADTEPGYSPPIAIEVDGKRQIVQWHAGAVAGLEPESGKVLWSHPFRMNVGLNVATPVFSGRRLLVTAFYNGPMMLELDHATSRIAWKGASSSERDTNGLHSLINTPVMDGDYIYGICSYGQFRCVDARTGKRVWETLEVTRENARWATGMIVKNGSRYFINNDRGELIIAEFSPQGYKEISRTELIKPTSKPGNRREREFVNWSHPAYANRHVYARNDEEIIAVSLER